MLVMTMFVMAVFVMAVFFVAMLFVAMLFVAMLFVAMLAMKSGVFFGKRYRIRHLAQRTCNRRLQTFANPKH